MASAGQFIKRLLQLARNRPSLSAADGAEVDLAQPNHLGRCATHEYLIGDVQLIA